jgi:hypothetical protein
MDSDARGTRNDLLKRRKARLANISRLDPISAVNRMTAPQLEAPVADYVSDQTGTPTDDTARERHIRDIQDRLRNGDYSLPAEQLAPILSEIFLSLRGQAQPPKRRKRAKKRDQSAACPPTPDDPEHML